MSVFVFRYLYNHSDKVSNDKLSELRNHCHLNAALACIKIGRFREAIEHCNGVSTLGTYSVFMVKQINNLQLFKK